MTNFTSYFENLITANSLKNPSKWADHRKTDDLRHSLMALSADEQEELLKALDNMRTTNNTLCLDSLENICKAKEGLSMLTSCHFPNDNYVLPKLFKIAISFI